MLLVRANNEDVERSVVLTSTAWLPAASNSGMRYVLIDLLRSGPLSVPTSNLVGATQAAARIIGS